MFEDDDDITIILTPDDKEKILDDLDDDLEDTTEINI